jgi:hypothetical protein
MREPFSFWARSWWPLWWVALRLIIVAVDLGLLSLKIIDQLYIRYLLAAW